MIPVNHPAVVPPLLARAFARNPVPVSPQNVWRRFNGKAQVKAALRPVQRGICTYCEESLDTWGNHIDHVVPKSPPNEAGTFVFTNLVISCIDSEYLATTNVIGTSCGHFRGQNYDPALFIHPAQPDCPKFFRCKMNGELEPAPGLSFAEQTRANYMIGALNLNCRRLLRRRRDWVLAMQRDMSIIGNNPAKLKSYLQTCLMEGMPFLTVVQEYFGWI